MTIIAAWHIEGQVFFVSDTAITRSRSPQSVSTSFGERVSFEDGRSSEECEAKIEAIGTNGIASYTGSVTAAKAFLWELQRSEQKFIPEAIMETALGRRTDQHPDQAFSLLIGGCDSAGNTFLCQFDSQCPCAVREIPPVGGGVTVKTLLQQKKDVDIEVAESAPQLSIAEQEQARRAIQQATPVLGSVSDETRFTLPSMVWQAILTTTEPASTLVSIVAWLQAVACNNAWLAQGRKAGGAMVGARVDSKGIHWMPSVTHYLFADIKASFVVGEVPFSDSKEFNGSIPTIDNLDRVDVIMHNGIAVTRSSYRKGEFLVLGKDGPAERQALEHAYKFLSKNNTEFVVFIQKARNNVVVVDRRINPENYFAIRGSLLYFRDDLAQKLQSPPRPGEPGRLFTLW